MSSSIKTKVVLNDERYRLLYKDIMKAMKKHGASLSAMELLAMASNIVGKLIAMQDQRTTTKEMAMEVVMRNIEEGNAQAIGVLLANTGGEA